MKTSLLSLCIAILAVACLDASTAMAEEPQESQLIMTLQDERGGIPFSAVVSIDPAEQLRYRMALASDLRADRIAKQQAAAGDVLVAANQPSVDYEKVQVTLIQPNLDKRRLESDDDGTMLLTNLMPGLNVLVAVGETTHGVQSIFVKSREEGDKPAFGEGLFEGEDLDPSSDERLMTLVNATRDEILPVVESYALNTAPPGGLETIKKDVVGSTDFDYRVQLTGDMELRGQLMSLEEDDTEMAPTNIVLYRGGQQIAQALTDPEGRFIIPDLRPDIYGIVAVGGGGYAAFSVEALAPDGLAAAPMTNANGKRFVSTVNRSLVLQGGSSLPIVMVPPAMVPEVVRTIEASYERLEEDQQEEEEVPPEMANFGPGYGGGGPGTGGGGGGGGGGGDFAGLAALGIAAAAAAANNDNGAIVVPIEPSPAVPGSTGPTNSSGTGNNPAPSVDNAGL